MSAEKAVAAVPRVQLKANEVFIVGRIETSTKRDDTVYTRIVCPAPDTYTQPGTVEVASKHRLGEVESDVQVHCRVTGYKKAGRDGDGDKIWFVNMRLVAVE